MGLDMYLYRATKKNIENLNHLKEVEDDLNKKVCLEIETWNICTESGHMTWVAVIGSRYNKKIWFDEDELENFETYDENGDLMK